MTRWLGATATSGHDLVYTPSLVGACAALVHAYPQLKILVNFFDTAPPVTEPAALARKYAGGSDRVEGYAVGGMKTLFWKRVLTPSRTRDVEVVWSSASG